MMRNNKNEIYNYTIEKIHAMETKKILNRGKAYSPNGINNWKKFAKVWVKFQISCRKEMMFDKVTIDSYYQFINFCENQHYKESTKYLYVTMLKAVLNSALSDGIHTNSITHNRNFVTHPQLSGGTPLYLTNSEIDKIYALSLIGEETLGRVRDIFLIGCYTGQRISDCLTLSLADIIYLEVEGQMHPVIKKVQQKTGSQVLIPMLNSNLLEILNKWGGHSPKVSISSINSKIKEICKRAGIEHCNRVSSHTARRSCITNLYLEGKLDLLQIRSISGHKSEEAFYRYICITQEERAKLIIKALK